MLINGRFYTEPEVQAHIRKLVTLISDMAALLERSSCELHKVAYEDCFSCVNKGSCAYKNDCQYKWEYADKVGEVLKEAAKVKDDEP